jgi:hypothetical protein
MYQLCGPDEELAETVPESLSGWRGPQRGARAEYAQFIDRQILGAEFWVGSNVCTWTTWTLGLGWEQEAGSTCSQGLPVKLPLVMQSTQPC